MKLYLLKPKAGLQDNPWAKVYDMCHGFVIRAESEAKARAMASHEGSDENDRWIKGYTEREFVYPWLSEEYSHCIELTIDGPIEVVLKDFRAG